MGIELPQLKEYFFNGEPFDTYDVLVKLKKKHNRPDLKLFPAGFLFDSEMLPADFDHYDCFWGSASRLIPFLKKHLSKYVIRDQVYVYDFPFNVFANCFTEGLPEQLLRRLVEVRSLEINGKVNDADQLVKVLEYLGRSLDQVKIKSSSLSQEIFDSLPEKCPVLSELSINEENQLNPAFILHFNSLKTVHFHQQSIEEIAKECFQKYEHFSSFFLYDGNDCRQLCRSKIWPRFKRKSTILKK